MDFEKRLAVVKVLLDLGVPVNSKSETLGTPLHFAVRNNCLKVAQLLVEYGANVEEVDEDSRTPLHLCAEFGDLEMAEFLLKGCEIRPKAVGEKYQIPPDVNIQEFQLAKLLLRYFKTQADELRFDLLSFSRQHYSRLVNERSRREQKEHRRAHDADDSCSCHPLLEFAGKAFDINSRLIDWEQFLTSYQNYQKTECRYHSKNNNSMFNKLKYAFGRYIDRWMRHTMKQVDKMKMFGNGANLLHLAVGYCCRSPIFNNFHWLLAGAMYVNNNDTTPNTDFKDKAVQSSTKGIVPTDFFTLLLDHVDTDMICSMWPFYDNGYNRCYQSTYRPKTFQTTGNLKSYVNRKDSEGYDALLKAVEFNKPDVVQLLLRNGADSCSITWLNIKWRRESPLFWLASVCIVKAEHKSIQTEAAKEIPSIKDRKERTLLHCVAMSTGYENLVGRNSLSKILLALGFKLDENDIDKRMDVSSSNLLFGVAQQIGMESTQKQRLIYRDTLEVKDVDDKTMDELWSLREWNAERERVRTSRYHQAVETVDLGTTRYVYGTMIIRKIARDPIEKGISWSIWTSGIADYAHRNTVTSSLTEEIKHFIERLANAIERKEPSFKCQPMLVGSAFEGTKIDSPDEFDFDFILTKFSNTVEVIPSPVAPEGFVHLRRKPSVCLKTHEANFFNKEGILLTREINYTFRIALSQVFQDPSFWEKEHLYELPDAEETIERLVRRYDRPKNCREYHALTDRSTNPGICTTIRLQPIGAIKGQFLSLDLVPCIHVNGWWPEKARSDVSDTLKANGCNLVFDQPLRKYPWVPFDENYARISFAPAESQIIRDSSPTAKAAYMVGKHLIKDKPQMTFVLKTCLLYCIEALDERYYSSVTNRTLSVFVETLMRCYLMFFLQDFCPCFLMPSFSLPIGDFLKCNHMFLHELKDNDYEFLREKNPSYLFSVREDYTTNFNLFGQVCTRNVDIPLPQPQPLCESFNHTEFISTLRGGENEMRERERNRKYDITKKRRKKKCRGNGRRRTNKKKEEEMVLESFGSCELIET